ncbi:glutathione S-transferase family protein [Phenylobacterium sp. LjRoot225]|uniref:glutathione S-transferase family protein n=1 Tax=Phenylobacterium sp. LjRoot225 TaxID=3342285 RepID=UPI003ECDF512
MLRILGRTSSINVRKVLWTAAEAGLAFEHEAEWAANRDTRSAEFLALNPNGLVPVVISEEGALWESNAICRYLAARAGRADLLPATPFARAQVETWMDWQGTELNRAWRAAFMALVRHSPEFIDDRRAIARSVEQWNGLMLLLERRLTETGAFVTGADFTLADVGLGLSLQRWLLTPIPRPATPALLAYRARLQGRPAAKAWIDPETP